MSVESRPTEPKIWAILSLIFCTFLALIFVVALITRGGEVATAAVATDAVSTQSLNEVQARLANEINKDREQLRYLREVLQVMANAIERKDPGALQREAREMENAKQP